MKVMNRSDSYEESGNSNQKSTTSLITAKAKAGEASERQYALFQGLHVLHTYLFSRLVPVPGDA